MYDNLDGLWADREEEGSVEDGDVLTCVVRIDVREE